MTKRELIHEVAYETGIQISESKEIVDAVFKVLTETLIRGEDIRIAGFATFKILDRPARNMINNATGEKMRTKAGKRVKEKISESIRKVINPAFRPSKKKSTPAN